MDLSFSPCPPARRCKTAAERREQKLRAAARAIGRFLKGVDQLNSHRGSQPTRIAAALKVVLGSKPDAGLQLNPEAPIFVPSTVGDEIWYTHAGSCDAVRGIAFAVSINDDTPQFLQGHIQAAQEDTCTTDEACVVGSNTFVGLTNGRIPEASSTHI